MTDKKSIVCPWIAALLLFSNLNFLTKNLTNLKLMWLQVKKCTQDFIFKVFRSLSTVENMGKLVHEIERFYMEITYANGYILIKKLDLLHMRWKVWHV